MSKSSIDFDDRTRKLITEYAAEYTRGNFTAAVNMLCNNAIIEDCRNKIEALKR